MEEIDVLMYFEIAGGEYEIHAVGDVLFARDAMIRGRLPVECGDEDSADITRCWIQSMHMSIDFPVAALSPETRKELEAALISKAYKIRNDRYTAK